VDRLFLRVYLNILVGIGVAAALAWLLVLPRADAQLERNAERTFAVPAVLMAEMLADRHRAGEDLERVIERLSKRSPLPFALAARSEIPLSPEELARIEHGEVVKTGPAFKSVFFARIEGADPLLQVGPMPFASPFGGGRGFVVVLLLAVGVSLGVFALLGRLRRQLADLRRTAESIGRGELGARAQVTSRDAIGAVAATMNRMGEEIQRLVAVREELLHMTSHELRTPLQRMHFSLESARSARATEDRERAFERMDRDLGELDRLIEELLTYVRLKERRAPVTAPVDVGPVIGELCETLTEVAGQVALVVRVPAEEELPVHGEARLIRRAASNLIVNALRYARSRVEVTATRTDGHVLIHVDDDGLGIPAESRERVFAPFERLEDEATGETRGFGLGLAIVRRIAETYGGSVVALDSELGGAQFRLSLPA